MAPLLASITSRSKTAVASSVSLLLLAACSRSPSPPVAQTGGPGPTPAAASASRGESPKSPGAAASQQHLMQAGESLRPSADCVHPKVDAQCKDGFCRVPAGCFVLGSPRDEFAAGRDDDVQVQVTLTRPFELGKFEVTNAEWSATGFALPRRNVDEGVCRDAHCPVSNVNLFEALTFANRYSEMRGLPACYRLEQCSGTLGSGPICNKPGKEPGHLECERKQEDGLICEGLYSTAASVYDCKGYRLPTEAEWEYAARAGTLTAYWNGEITPEPTLGECGADARLARIGWYCHNSGGRQHPVGQLSANPWGFHDMLGNVSEWTADAIHLLGYGKGPLIDPKGYWWSVAGEANRSLMPIGKYGDELSKQNMMATRGGNYQFPASSNKVNKRAYVAQVHQGTSVLGLRLARTLER